MRIQDIYPPRVAASTAPKSLIDAVATMREPGVKRLSTLDKKGDLADVIAADVIGIALSNPLKIPGEIAAPGHIGEIHRRREILDWSF